MRLISRSSGRLHKKKFYTCAELVTFPRVCFYPIRHSEAIFALKQGCKTRCSWCSHLMSLGESDKDVIHGVSCCGMELGSPVGLKIPLL